MVNLGFTITENLNRIGKCVLHRPITGNSDLAVKTRNIYITGTVTDSAKLKSNDKIRFWQWRVRENVVKWLRQRRTTGNDKIGTKTSVLPFPVVGCCRNCLGTILFKLAVVDLLLKINFNAYDILMIMILSDSLYQNFGSTATLLFPVGHLCRIFMMLLKFLWAVKNFAFAVIDLQYNTYFVNCITR